jgi:poly(3-hydroxybutyrate) depolymerase
MTTRTFWSRIAAAALLSCLHATLSGTAASQNPTQPGRHRVEVLSTADGSLQPSYLILPPNYRPDGGRLPVVVALHSWSATLEQRYAGLETAVGERGWIYLFPNFRGMNDKPEACASDLAVRDVIDALDWVIRHYPVDQERVYVTGFSGGGLMTLVTAARFPHRWTAASAWVPLSDLRAWYDFHARDQFGEMSRACFGGAPAENPTVATTMAHRSPLHRMNAAKDLAIDIAAGRFDGHDGAPVPVWHSLATFNEIARALGTAEITAQEIAELSRHEPRLERPQASDRVTDSSFGRQIFLRRHAGRSRVTIFDGGHEMLDTAIIAWFEAHQKR